MSTIRPYLLLYKYWKTHQQHRQERYAKKVDIPLNGKKKKRTDNGTQHSAHWRRQDERSGRSEARQKHKETGCVINLNIFNVSMKNYQKYHPVQRMMHHELMWEHHHRQQHLHPHTLQKDRLRTSQTKKNTIHSVTVRKIRSVRYAKAHEPQVRFAKEVQKKRTEIITGT